MKKKFQRGLVIGKFYPPHNGHKYLIDTATKACEKLSIICCANRHQSIPGEVRAQWLREIHPLADVILIDDEGIPESDSPLWARLTVQWLGFTPDAVFTSESYGKPWAQALGCSHVEVDMKRQTVPCSGTQIRQNPLQWLNFVQPQVATYLRQAAATRIVVLGAESTGTTTLARALARYYEAPCVPEYGRDYTLEKLAAGTLDKGWESSEFLHIAEQQNKLEDEAASKSSLVICDTNAFATMLWEERYCGRWSKKLEEIALERKYALYILTSPEIPFVQDGIRDGEHIRLSMHERFLQELQAFDMNYIVAEGSREHRLQTAVKAIDSLGLNAKAA